MDRQDDEKPAGPSRLTEPLAWIGCLVAAILPTAMLASFVQSLDRAAWPLFTPLACLGVFTIMVLALQPWTHR